MAPKEIEDGLAAAREALIGFNFCGVSPQGKGDPEINSIDTVLRYLRSGRRLDKLASLGFHDAANFARSPQEK